MNEPPTESAIASALAVLSRTQRERLIASLNGQTATAIAKREGVSPQAVAETLARPEVRDVTMRVAGHVIRARDAGGVCELISRLLGNLQEIAFGATRVVGVGGAAHEVPDYRMRFDASLQLLGFVAPPEATTQTRTFEEHVSSETTVRTRALRRHRAP